LADPERVIIAGDWHGNFLWAASQLAAMRCVIPEEEEEVLYVLHCGDFGFWPGSSFAEDVDFLARGLGIRIWVTPGNHDDYRGKNGVPAWLATTIEDNNALIALKRGTRWSWHGHEWLSVGGATSPDRSIRIEGANWWPEEEVTYRDVIIATARGPADVLLTHDVGHSVPLRLPAWPRVWGEAELKRAQAHRLRMDAIFSAVKPQLWLHGHYHLFHESLITGGERPCRVTGLSLDGGSGNWGVLSAKSLEWEAFNT
jgi:hypothetical protein